MMSFFPVTKTTIKKFHLQLKYSELHVNSELVSTLISLEVCSNAPFPFLFPHSTSHRSCPDLQVSPPFIYATGHFTRPNPVIT